VTPSVADEEPTQERVGLGLVRRPRKPPAGLGRSVVVQAHERDVAPVVEVPIELVREPPGDEPVPFGMVGDRREVVVAAVRDRHAIEETPRSLSATFRLSPPCPARWTTLMPPRPISPSTLWPAISDPQVERLLDGRVR